MSRAAIHPILEQAEADIIPTVCRKLSISLQTDKQKKIRKDGNYLLSIYY